jgi:zinc finger CCHC domain-containing protein 8
MAEDLAWHSRGQFQDAVMIDTPSFVDEQGDPSNYLCSTSPLIYERSTSNILGAETEDRSPLDGSVTHCFNCGSTHHIVSSCPAPYNTELIALSRQMYNFFKPSRSTEQMTLSAAAEFKHQRRQWIDSFEPGHVQGFLLREALGLHDDDVCSNLPWLKNMADWGYPSGWFSEEDPRERVLQRIDSLFVESTDTGEGNHFLAIFGDDAVEILDISSPPVPKPFRREDTEKVQEDPRECPVIQLDHAQQVEPGRSRRWATYPSSYFSSDLLPVYNGTRLPPVLPMTSSTFTSERHLLWERILHDADSTRMQGPVFQGIGRAPQHNSPSPPPPVAPPPPLPPLPSMPPLPLPAPATNSEVDETLPGGQQADTSRDGESDMEMSDSDS